MALKKSQLYSSLWQSCDELRGGMDASQYKDYVLTLLFMKYVSDKYAGKPGALIEVPKGGSFADMVALKGDKEIGDRINKIISRLAEANDLKGVIDQANFNDESRLGAGKEMVDRLSKLVAIFNDLDFRANRAEGDDLLGDAYEYLMRHFATESGKSKGQFYTPAEVSRIMAQVIGIERAAELREPTVYDPTCGSGSLLIKAVDEAATLKLAIYGQEMDVATWALARMNMFLHGHPTHDLWRGNTLSAPHFTNKNGLKTFDFAVANPPFSAKAWSNGLDPAHDEFKRFELGIPPAKNGDYAFLLHLIGSLKSTGKGAIILPHGVLFRGNREADIRRNLIGRGLIKGIIGLPANLFYGTGIPACIVVIDKEHAQARSGIFMIDASKGFVKDGNKNRLRAQDIHRIVDVFTRQIEVPRYSRMVSVTEIASPANDYNLNLPRYIDSSEPEDLHDLDAHLNGGIPDRDIDALDSYWKEFPSLRKVLFADADDLHATPSGEMNHAYFETHFRLEESADNWPECFAIITAWQTTGESWSEAKNRSADGELRDELQRRGKWVRRLTGFSPRTGYAEPSWAVEIDFESACDLGKQFRQDAIYNVDRDDLAVSHCDERRARVPIGSFRARLWQGDRCAVRPGYSTARVEAPQVKATILAHAEFATFAARAAAVFDDWCAAHRPALEAIEVDDLPRQLIETLSEDLLLRFADLPLLSRYDIYQRLMDYWADAMQDDVYLIAADGWPDAARPRGIVEDTDRKIKETPDLSIGRKKYKMDLVPPALVVAHYFGEEQAAIDALQAKQEAAARELEEFAEEHGGDEGLLADALNDKGKVTKACVRERLMAVEDEAETDDERKALEHCLALIEAESAASRLVKAAQSSLEEKVLARYAKLGEAEIKTLVVEDKWLASLRAAVDGEVQRLTQQLASRIKELEERYALPLPAMEHELDAFSAKVAGHLEKMGMTWR